MASSSSESRSSERLLRWIPVAAALALAALYSVGALLTAAGLRGAGLSVRDTLPLFSLEKLLARGISTLIGSVLLMAALALLGLLIFGSGPRLRRRAWSRGGAIAASASGVALVVVVLGFVSPVLASAVVLSLLAGLVAARWLPDVPRPWVWAGQYILVLAGFIASAYVYPQPLPRAEVEVTDGPPFVGDLVTTTDLTWYVAGFEDDAIRAIPAADIVDARFFSREREDPPRLKDVFD